MSNPQNDKQEHSYYEDLAPPSFFREGRVLWLGQASGGRWARRTSAIAAPWRCWRWPRRRTTGRRLPRGTDTNLAIAVLYGTAQERAAAMGDSRVRDLAEKGPADKRIYLPGDAELLMAVRAADAAVCDAAAYTAAAECAV